jgi:hypothetical protein
MTEDDVSPSVLQDFVPANYPQTKRNILIEALRGLKRIHQQREWEDWQSVLAAFTLITEEVAAEIGEPDIRNVDSGKGSPFQTRFLPRWERFEALLGGNFKPLSRGERSYLRELVKHPEALEWRGKREPHQQRGLTHPNRVITAWRAATRDKNPDAKPSLATTQQRVIVEQDEKLELHRKTITDLRAQLDDHEWNYDDEVGELLLTLATKIKNRSTTDQITALAVLLKALGWSNELFTAMARLTRSAPKPKRR